MSEIEKLDPTGGGDAASVVETAKTDCADDAIESADRVPKDAIAPKEEIAISASNLQTENELSINEEDGKVEGRKSAVEIESFTAIGAQNSETPQTETEEKADKSKRNARDNNQTYISKLEAEVQKRTKERDGYRRKLEDAEAKLAALQSSYDATIGHNNGEDILQGTAEQLRVKLAQTALMYEERSRVVANQENQINALNKQVISLKEVVSITRDLLQIRNMEVKQLQTEVDNMEKKISEERDRHNMMIGKMDAAMRLNADLKKEYETQLSLFQHLREKYDEKIVLLSGGKETLAVSTSE